jgi:hypothetical protein
MGFCKGIRGLFSNFAKAKKRVPAYADLANPFETWAKDSVGLEEIGGN